jgi:tRNA 5-methylaminomethyl-2-thiouridine biosynthesis bifunctional protein
LRDLRAALCHRGYIAPATGQIHAIGATFGPNDAQLDHRPEDDEHNLLELTSALAIPDAPTPPLGSHAALRCNSSDYLPLAGPVPEGDAFRKAYAGLADRGKQVINTQPPLREGLWCLTGLGSRGLTAAPMAAELITSQILGEPPPLPRYLCQSVSPARFLVRELKRAKQ